MRNGIPRSTCVGLSGRRWAREGLCPHLSKRCARAGLSGIRSEAPGGASLPGARSAETPETVSYSDLRMTETLHGPSTIVASNMCAQCDSAQNKSECIGCKYTMLLTSYSGLCYINELCRRGCRPNFLHKDKAEEILSVQGGGMEARFVHRCLCLVVLACLLGPLSAAAENSYVGTEACKECHENEYSTFTKFAKKAHSDQSVQIMASDLSQEELAECYGCHTTGYGKPGGFISHEKTPQMADAGCEVCHGPGHDHVDSGGDPELIKGKLTLKDCEGCHNEERVKSFNFKPLLYGGAH